MSSAPFDIGPYHCVQRLAGDETFEVYLAELTEGSNTVQGRAVLRLSDEARALPKLPERLRKSAERAAGLQHRGVARLHGYEEHDGQSLLSSDYVDGISLRRLLERLQETGEAMPWNIALRIAIEAAEALDHGHRQKPPLLHGGPSPSNLMLTWSSEVRLLHFGVAAPLAAAKHRLRDEPATELLYQAPELLQGQRTDPSSDLFALGAVLFEALSGRRIFEFDDRGNRRLSRKQGRSLGEEGRLLRPVLRRVLAAKAADRFPRAQPFVEALEEVLIERAQFVSGTPVDVWLGQVTGQDTLADLDFDDADSLVRVPKGKRPKRPTAPSPPGGAPARPESPTPPPASATRVPIASPAARSTTGSSLPALDPLRAERRTGATPAAGEATPAARDDRPGGGRGRTLAVVIMGAVAAACAAAALILYLQRSGKNRATSPASRAHDPIAAQREGTPPPRDGRRATAADARRVGRRDATRRRPGRPGAPGPGPASRVARAGARPRDAREAPTPRDAREAPTPRDAREAPTPRDAREAPTPRDTREAPAPRDARDASQGLGAVPMQGPRKARELDLYTAPKQVSVIHDGRVLGTTPLRLRGRAGRLYLLVLNREGYRVKTTQIRLSGYGGLLLRDVLAHLPYPTPKARQGQTRVSVRCRTQNVRRIFINGRDTGRNCPATLKVGTGTNNVGVLLPRQKRTAFKHFRAKRGQAVEVSFPH